MKKTVEVRLRSVKNPDGRKFEKFTDSLNPGFFINKNDPGHKILYLSTEHSSLVIITKTIPMPRRSFHYLENTQITYSERLYNAIQNS